MVASKEPFDWGDLMDEINDIVKQVNGVLMGVKEQLYPYGESPAQLTPARWAASRT